MELRSGEHFGQGTDHEGQLFSHARTECRFRMQNGQTNVTHRKEADHALRGAQGETLFQRRGVKLSDEAGGFLEKDGGSLAEMTDIFVFLWRGMTAQAGSRSLHETGAQDFEPGGVVDHILRAQQLPGGKHGAERKLDWVVDVSEAEVLDGRCFLTPQWKFYGRQGERRLHCVPGRSRWIEVVGEGRLQLGSERSGWGHWGHWCDWRLGHRLEAGQWRLAAEKS